MANAAAYRTGPVKRRRRSKAEMQEIKDAIFVSLSEEHPQTVRGLFYQLTSAGVIEKTDEQYKGTVCRLLAEMRRDRTIPYSWLADSTRWMRRPRTFSSIEDALESTASTYRRALWEDAECQVEIWLEKEALAGILDPITRPWDVPLMVCKGYPSMSFTHSAAEAIGERAENNQRTQLYYLGDHDPSGIDIDRVIVNNIGESLLGMFDWSGTCYGADGADATAAFYYFASFERIGVTEEQIDLYGLQTRPTKKSDTRGKNFKGESVEVDAIPNPILRAITNDAIEQHVDQRRIGVLRQVEEEERRGLEALALKAGEGEIA